MEKPRKPGKRAGAAEWDRYRTDLAAWQTERQMQQQGSGWQSGGSVDGQPARTRQQGGRTDALWGGEAARGDGSQHGHIVGEGEVATYVRYPGEAPVYDDSWKNYGYGSYGEEGERYH